MPEKKSRSHFFDLKIPLGSLLSFYGLILLLYGLFGPRHIYEKSLGLNVNLIWGAVIMVVGALFLGFAHFRRRDSH
jgi:high-affinity Fe2+/Pb2+ permease